MWGPTGSGRTLPRVRELKLVADTIKADIASRTLPRVRELKHDRLLCTLACRWVAPFPGCVN